MPAATRARVRPACGVSPTPRFDLQPLTANRLRLSQREGNEVPTLLLAAVPAQQQLCRLLAAEAGSRTLATAGRADVGDDTAQLLLRQSLLSLQAAERLHQAGRIEASIRAEQPQRAVERATLLAAERAQSRGRAWLELAAARHILEQHADVLQAAVALPLAIEEVARDAKLRRGEGAG